MPRKSFAMVLTGTRKLEPRDLPLPEISDDTALLRVETCGICGTDYEQYNGVIPGPLPAIPGHEPLGVIEAIGDGAARRWGVDVGDRVAVENMICCGTCAACLAGERQLCARRRVYAFLPVDESPGLWGAYSQYLFLDAGSIVHRMDASLPAELAVLFNPLGAGYRWAVALPQTKPGDTLLINGPGQRGLASVLAASEAGASQIIVTGLAADARTLALAKTFGAHATIDVENEDVRSRVRELTDGRGADVIVDVSPHATEPITEALDNVALGGTVIVAGMKGQRPIPDFLTDKLVVKEITLRGAIGVDSASYRNAIRLIESGSVPLEKMHTHDFALADAELAIRTLAREVEGQDAIHCCVTPEH
jgi:2-desacetyl-2-hydroxyethyl bacteriochlorophyllide A dehydrogenase